MEEVKNKKKKTAKRTDTKIVLFPQKGTDNLSDANEMCLAGYVKTGNKIQKLALIPKTSSKGFIYLKGVIGTGKHSSKKSSNSGSLDLEIDNMAELIETEGDIN